MYEKNLLKIGEVLDSRNEDGTTYWLQGLYLPHSCNEWVIGGPEEIKILIADLEKALKNFELI